MNPNSETDRDRLKRAIEWSKNQFRAFRDVRTKLIKEYVGPGYGENTIKWSQFMPLIYQAATTYQFTLAANRPRVLVNTQRTNLQPFSRRFQINLNNLIQEICLEVTLQQSVLEAFFKFAVVKVCMADSVEVELEPNKWADPGRPFARVVSLDRYLHDMTAERIPELRWALDYYDVDFDSLKDANVFDQKVVEDLRPSEKRDPANRDGQDTAAQLSQGGRTSNVSVYDCIELVDVWFPKGRIVATFDSSFEHPPLAVRDYDGPESGPYKYLSFDDVPDNTMPTSPGEQILPLHELINSLSRKAARQAKSAKTVTFYEGGAEEDARGLQRSNDNDFRKVNDISRIGQWKSPGVDPGNQAFAMQAMDVFDRFAGNLQSMAGLGPQADTLGQENMISATVSKKAAAMKYRVRRFTADIATDLGWLLWSDKAMQREAYEELEGFPDIRIPMNWSPDIREGDFAQYEFDIEPQSMDYQDAGQRFQTAMMVADKVMQYSQTPQGLMAGATVDLQVMVDMAAELLNNPQVRRLVRFEGAPPDNMLPSPGDGPRQAASTTRTNVRKNVASGVGQQGQRAAAIDQYMSQAKQQNGGVTQNGAAA